MAKSKSTKTLINQVTKKIESKQKLAKKKAELLADKKKLDVLRKKLASMK